MYDNKSPNTFVRNLYSPGFSCLRLSLYKLNMTFSFNPYMGKDNRGFSQYDMKTFLSTSVNYEGAAGLYFVAMSILEGKYSECEIELVLKCGKDATLTFEYKREQDNKMFAWLVINKLNQTMPFRFTTHEYKARENGQVVTKVAQTGLGVFAKALEGYLIETGGANHLSKLPDDVLYPEGIPPLPMED